jgi:5-methylcytosine-specific restriction endonuclease McrA
MRMAVLQRDGFTCAYCGNEATQVDHVVPKAAGGTDTLDNLVAACAEDNQRKGAKPLVRRPYWNTKYLNHLPA